MEPSTDAASQRLAGTVIAGKYRLDELLGAGSQGMVWKAHNLDLDLPVAVKLMHPLSEVGMALAPNRLFREARAAATLGHPGIVRIFDFGRTADGLPFLTMELLHGVSLARHLDEVGKLSPELAVRLMLPIADALSAAHAQGIVHRDVKPDNILLAESAGQMQPKLLDFGIARVADGQPLTQVGAVVGTPNYLPPEQARGLDEVDARADVWALCATLYECVTGAVPFPASTWIDVLRRIIDDDPAPLSTHGINDAELWRLISKGLAKHPDDRWASMQEFATAASRWLLAREVSCDICGTSVESRWLRPLTAPTLKSGETASGATWWEQQPPASAPRRLSAARRRLLTWSAPVLCMAAIVGVARAGAWVFTSPSALTSDPEVEALPQAAAAPVAAALPLPELVTVRGPTSTADVTDTKEANHAKEANGVRINDAVHRVAPVSKSDERLQGARSEPATADPITLAKSKPAPAPRAPGRAQVAARRVPPKAAATAARDTLDLMNPY